MKSLLQLLGRIFYALPFLVFGCLHLINGKAMTGMVPKMFPGGVLWIYLAGLGMIAAAISIIIRKYDKLACILLAIMLLIFILTIHLPGLGNPDKMMMQMAMASLLKDMALMGAALAFAANAK